MIRAIEWTRHAEERLESWRLDRFEVEEAVRRRHRLRVGNRGDGDWRIDAPLGDRLDTLVVIYDHEEDVDSGMAKIVTVWAF
jgi:hypothetical protein